MNPSPYLLRFSGLASQWWTCPSTTKYFSPSFSYTALSSFSRTTIRPNELPDVSSYLAFPHLKKDLSRAKGKRPSRDRSKALWLPFAITSFPRFEAGPARFRPTLRGADDKRLRI